VLGGTAGEVYPDEQLFGLCCRGAAGAPGESSGLESPGKPAPGIVTGGANPNNLSGYVPGKLSASPNPDKSIILLESTK